MKTIKQNIVVLEEGDSISIATSEREGSPASELPRAVLHIHRTGSDKGAFPLQNPHFLVEFVQPWGEFANGREVAYLRAGTHLLVTGPMKECSYDHPPMSDPGCPNCERSMVAQQLLLQGLSPTVTPEGIEATGDTVVASGDEQVSLTTK